MPLVLSGSTGIVSGNIADGTITASDLATGAARANFGAGAVLQVVNAEYTSVANAATGLLVDIFSANITPSSTTSKIYVIANVFGGINETNTNRSTYAALCGITRTLNGTRTVLLTCEPYTDLGTPITGDSMYLQHTLTKYDSPLTTDTVSYAVAIATRATNTTDMRFSLNRTNGYNTDARTSSITLMEIAT